MSTPSTNSSIKRREAEDLRPVPEKVAKLINALCRSALGRSAGVEEMVELAQVIARAGDRRAAVESVSLMEASLVRLAEPWFWKLLSRAATEKEMGTPLVRLLEPGAQPASALQRAWAAAESVRTIRPAHRPQLPSADANGCGYSQQESFGR